MEPRIAIMRLGRGCCVAEEPGVAADEPGITNEPGVADPSLLTLLLSVVVY